MGAPSGTVPERFERRVDRSAGHDACWPWTGATDKKGYGALRGPGAAGGVLKTHRVAWELTNGPIPEGLMVLHRCDNPPCCNPAHLFLGTVVDNNRDMWTKGRGRNNNERRQRNARGQYA